MLKKWLVFRGVPFRVIAWSQAREKCLFYYSILGLNEYTTFRVSVAANNSFGIGPYSQPVEVKTQESSKSIVMFVFQVLRLLFFSPLTFCVATIQESASTIQKQHLFLWKAHRLQQWLDQQYHNDPAVSHVNESHYTNSPSTSLLTVLILRSAVFFKKYSIYYLD